MTECGWIRPVLATWVFGMACVLSAPSIAGVDPAGSIRGHMNAGRYAEAEVEARQALAGLEEAGDSDSLRTAEILDLLVEAIWREGKGLDPEARRIAERSIAMKERRLGPDHPEVGRSLNLLGRVLPPAEARPVLERALKVRETALGPDHPDVAESLNSLGSLISGGFWEYERGRDFIERGLSVREKTLGQGHVDVAESLDSLGTWHWGTGDYEAARSMHARALAIREKALGPDHPLVAESLDNLAVNLMGIGDYEQARVQGERAIAIVERTLGPNHPNLAKALNNLGAYLLQTGDYRGSIALAERAGKIWGDTPGGGALALHQIAWCHRLMGEFEEARKSYESAIARWNNNERIGMTMTDLGDMLSEMGEFREAKPILEQGLAIRERLLAAGHLEIAESISALAGLHRNMGDYVEARRLFERVVSIFEASLPAGHPRVAESLKNLAIVLFEMGDDARAVQVALRAEGYARDHLRLTIRTLPEREALLYAAERSTALDLALHLAAKAADPTMRREAWDSLIRSRALVLDEMAARHRTAVFAGDPEIDRLIESVTRSRRRVANLSLRGPGGDAAVYRGLLAEAQREKDQAEQALARKSVHFRQEQARAQTGFGEVAASLPPGSALVAFVRCDPWRTVGRMTVVVLPGSGQAGPIARQEPAVAPSYLAFVLQARQSAPTMIPLGKADEIDHLVADWRQEAGRRVVETGRAGSDAVRTYRTAGEALRRRVWDPVQPAIGAARMILVVPDGALSVVNLAALPVGDQAYLVEKGPLIHQLSAERDLVTVGGGAPGGSGLLALGGPDFDARSRPGGGPAERIPVSGTRVVASSKPYQGLRSGCGDFKSLKFASLPGSAAEAKEIVDLWREASTAQSPEVDRTKRTAPGRSPRVEVLTGAEAAEGVFKSQAPGKRVLHLATHGFFLGDRCGSALSSTRGIGGLRPGTSSGIPALQDESPLVLSGLVLAGANLREEAGADEDDGILTAEEIAALDLSGTEWAVLSACDTGVGEVRAGEGVFGLRRAFQVAGAQSVIMSLWSVDDEAAREYMRALYEAHFGSGSMTTAEAVRHASLTALRGRRARGDSPHPFYWAPFVAVGNWE